MLVLFFIICNNIHPAIGKPTAAETPTLAKSTRNIQEISDFIFRISVQIKGIRLISKGLPPSSFRTSRKAPTRDVCIAFCRASSKTATALSASALCDSMSGSFILHESCRCKEHS